MTTEKQIAANRQNAQNSTGPATPEGKALASQNSVKHGLFAQRTLISDEDPADFERHSKALLAALKPADAMEEMLAHRIVTLSWRLLRTGRMQAETYDYMGGCTKEPSLGHPARDLALGKMAADDFSESRVLERLLKYESKMEHALYKAWIQFRRLQVHRADRLVREAWLMETDPGACMQMLMKTLKETERREKAEIRELEKTNPILTYR